MIDYSNPLFTYARERNPMEDGTYQCLIHDFEAGDFLYIEMVEFKDGAWIDFGEVVWMIEQIGSNKQVIEGCEFVALDDLVRAINQETI